MQTGVLERLTHRLRRAVRLKAGRHPSPSLALIDSPSVKTSSSGGVRGFDGGKNVQGRKRHIVTDTLGLLLAVLVHSAALADRQQAPHLLKRLVDNVPRLRVILADRGYVGTPAGLVHRCFGWMPELVHRPRGERGFVVVKRRWVVERTFAWFGGSRRLSKDYEYLPQVSEAMVQLCAIRLMIRRIA
jgi:transposase